METMKKLSICLVLGLLLPSAAGLARESPARPQVDGLTVVSLNVALREDIDLIVSELEAAGAARADVMLLQEVMQRDGNPDVAAQLAARLGLRSVYREAFRLDDTRAFGQATLSRYPIDDVRELELKQFDFAFRDKHRIALAATLDTPGGRVRTYNMHLDTRINVNDRLEQISAVVDDMATFEEPVIIGGDFNTNNNRWFFHTIPLPWLHRQGRGLERYMETLGFHSAFDGTPTHDALRMRLDWVFLRGLQAATASIHPLDMSDHHALVVSVVPGTR
jgi:endonuclease/exonuclease/phosphatase family metal-dependent hydrolase